MPRGFFVKGFLRLRKRPGRPVQPLPPEGGGGDEGPVDPDYGLEGPELPEIDPPEIDGGLPEPPPGVWPGPTPTHPWVPVDPEDPAEPGEIWPPVVKPGVPKPPKPKKIWLLVYIPGIGVKYICVDPNLRPEHLPDLPGREPK